MPFHPPTHFIIAETEHWIVNHRVDSKLPGYLMIGSRADTNDLHALPPAALAELGPLQAWAQGALQKNLRAEHVYLGRYGHQTGTSLHFHVIPIYDWLKAVFMGDLRYRVLRTFRTPGAGNTVYDGAELTLYVWREFCESTTPPLTQGPSVPETVELLRKAWPANG